MFETTIKFLKWIYYLQQERYIFVTVFLSIKVPHSTYIEIECLYSRKTTSIHVSFKNIFKGSVIKLFGNIIFADDLHAKKYSFAGKNNLAAIVSIVVYWSTVRCLVLAFSSSTVLKSVQSCLSQNLIRMLS